MGKPWAEETIDGLTDRLQSVLPATWRVYFHPIPGRAWDGALMLIAGDGTDATVLVTLKRWRTEPTSAVAGVLAGIKHNAPDPVLLVTDYTNRALRKACSDLGINYVDEAGWLYLQLDEPALFLRTDGADRRQPRQGNEVTRLTGIAATRTIRALLRVAPPVGVRALQLQAGVASAGSVSKLLPTLAAANVISRGDNGEVLTVDRRGLLGLWTQDYSFLRSNQVEYYLAPRGIDGVRRRLKNKHGMCVTGTAAAAAYLHPGTVPVVPTGTLHLYSDRRDLDEDLGLVPADKRTGNVIVAFSKDSDLTENPSYDDHEVPIAPRAQVLADLMSLPGRESLLAEQIMDQLATTDPLWREQ